MTKEEFDKLEDKWQTVYLDGKTPIRMVSKRSSKEDCILWYDSYEYSHTTHYSRITLELSDFEKELDRLANEYVGNHGCEDYDDCVEAYKAGYREALEQ